MKNYFLCFFLGILLWAAPSQATILLQEDWEGTDADINTRWPDGWSSCPSTWPRTSSPGVSTTRAFSGTHSLKFHYTGHQQSHIDAGLTGPGTLGTALSFGCASTALFTPAQEIWLTWYEWIDSGFQMDEITTKSWLIYGARSVGDQFQDFVNGYNDQQSPSPGARQLWLGLQTVFDGTQGGTPWGNASYSSSYTHPFNNWVCYEQRLKMNDAGVANAAAELYATNMTLGTPTITAINQQNHQWMGTSSSDPWPIGIKWGSIKVYVQDGIGDLYRDKITVSTTRVGCGGTPQPGDTTPPPIPTLTVAENVSGQATASWNTVIDTGGSGLSGFNILRCTGVGCIPITTIQTLGPSAVSYVDTTIASSTTYGYAINAFDVAGNSSVNSATIYITTNAVVTGGLALDATSISPEIANVSTTNWSHTIGAANNRVLLVCTQSRGTVQANQVVSSVNIGGIALTKIRDDEAFVSSNYFHTSVWQLIAPPTGVGTITVNWAGVPGVYSVGSAASFSGVDQTSPIDAQAGGNGAGTTLSATITTVTANAWIVDCALGQGGTITVGAGQTMRNDRLIGAGGLNDGTGLSTVNGKATPGAETMDWTQLVAEAWAISTVSLKPVTTVTGVIGFDAVSDSATTNTTNTINWSHTVGSGDNRFMLVCAQSRATTQANAAVSSITGAGGAFTKIRHDERSDGAGNFLRTELWRRTAPASGTSTITITWAGALQQYGVGSAISFSGVDQTSPIDSQNGSTGGVDPLSVAMTTVTDNAWIADCTLGSSSLGLVVGSGQTSRSNRIVGGATADGAGMSTVNGKTPAGAETQDYTSGSSGSGGWAMSAVSLNPVAALVEPVIASMAIDATGLNLTYGATTPTQIRIATHVSSTIYPISGFPGGRFTAPGGSWPPGNQVDRFVCASAINASGVENLDAAARQCKQPPELAVIDTAPPVLSNGQPSSIRPAGTTSVILSTDTDKPAFCRWSLTNIDYDSMDIVNQMTRLSLTSSATISGLTDGYSTVYYVGCTFQDVNGVFHNSTNIAITIAVDVATPDTTPPGTITDLRCNALPSGTQASCVWSTATGGDIAGYQLLGSTGVGSTNYLLAGQPVVETQIVVSLLPNTVHNFVVLAIDTSGNPSAAYSNVSTITTTSNIDLNPPEAMTGLRQDSVGRNFAILAWDACVDDRGTSGCTAIIEKSPAGCAAFQLHVSQLAERRLVVELAASTTYCFRGKWNDGTNNGPYSANLELTTTADGFSEPRAPVPYPYRPNVSVRNTVTVRPTRPQP